LHHHQHHQFDLHGTDAYSPYHQYHANSPHHHNPYALSAAAAASASVGERLMRATAAGESFGHQYDAASRAYSEYASYYAASRHAAVLDPDSLQLYRNGIFSAANNSSPDNNNPVFRVSFQFTHSQTIVFFC
jgi:hypothetical protein